MGVNPQPGQTMIIRCPLEAAPLARLCVRSGFEAGARDVQVDWSDNAVSRTRMELGSEEALTDSKPYQLRRYLDYAESEGSVCVLRVHAHPNDKVSVFFEQFIKVFHKRFLSAAGNGMVVLP